VACDVPLPYQSKYLINLQLYESNSMNHPMVGDKRAVEITWNLEYLRKQRNLNGAH